MGMPTGGRRDAVRLVVGVVLIACVVAGGVCAFQQLFGKTNKEVEMTQDKREPQPAASKVDRVVKKMTLEQKVAQVFVVEPEAITGVDAAIIAGDMTREALERYPVGGFCYFAKNLESPDQTKELIANAQKYAKDACGLPLFACVDEEGGLVSRVASNAAFGVEDIGDMAAIGAAGSAKKARKAAAYVGGYLSELGFNVDFAPVADIATSQDGTMADRSFGATPDEVAPMVAAMVKGFAQAGVLCSAKHFPGIGAAEGDSHNESIYSNDSVEEMLKWSLVPFKEAIKAGVPMIMVGHLSCRGLKDQGTELPASLNPQVIEGILRKRLNYDGLAITDSLQMEAAQVCTPDQQAVMALEAGADLVLMPADFEQAYEGLLAAIRDGTMSEDRLDESVRRIVAAKLDLA